MEYYYKGKKVEVCDKYSSHWVYVEVGGERVGKQGDPAHFTPVNQAQSPPAPTAPQTPSTPTPVSSLPVNPTELHINSATKAQLKKAFQGKIGASGINAILERKPYKSWSELTEINSDLGVNWDEIQNDTPIEIKF